MILSSQVLENGITPDGHYTVKIQGYVSIKTRVQEHTFNRDMAPSSLRELVSSCLQDVEREALEIARRL